MVITSTAKRYARAIFELAREKGQLEQLMKELDEFSNLVAESEQLKKLLTMPNSDKKIAVVEDILQARFSDLFREFLLLLIRNMRANLLPQIREEMQHRYDELQSRVRATVISAIPLTKELEDEIKSRLEKKIKAKLIIENQVDPNILGGFVVKMNGQVLDASVVDKFKKLKMYLTQN